MIRKKVLPLLFVLFFIASIPLAAQQEYILKGELRDQSNKNEPVAMASITVKGTNIATVTDSKGRFTLKLNPADLEKKIIVTATGYSNMPFDLQNKNYWSVTIRNFQVNFWLDKITNARADSDNDKVPDEIDKCPDQAGTSDNYGCPELTNKPFKNVNWNIQSINTVTKKDVDGQEREADVKQFMKYEVKTTRILPTKSSEKLVIALNPKLKDNAKIKNGETIMFPLLPEMSEKRVQELNEDYAKELSADEIGQFTFVKLANRYETLVEKFPPPEKLQSVAEQLQSIKKLLSEAKFGPYKKLRKIDTDMLNAELEDFNNNYLKGRGRRIDSVDVNDLYYTVSTLLKPYLFRRVKPEIFKKADIMKFDKSGPSAFDEAENDETGIWYDEVLQSEITVNFYVYTQTGVVSADSFWVYCLSEPFYRRLLNGGATLEHLRDKGFRCPRYASPTGKPINPSFKWYFVAVTKDAERRIVGTEPMNGREIQLDPQNTNADTRYAVTIMIEN
jgi:hypothetical protein